MKKQSKNGGYDHSTAAVKPYSANPRTGERIDNPARLDPRNAAAEKQSYPRAGSGRREMQADNAARKEARQSAAERQDKVRLQKRGGH